jgi:hypothetical protein
MAAEVGSQSESAFARTRLSPALQNDAWQDQGLAHHVSLFHQNKRTCRRI